MRERVTSPPNLARPKNRIDPRNRKVGSQYCQHHRDMRTLVKQRYSQWMEVFKHECPKLVKHGETYLKILTSAMLPSPVDPGLPPLQAMPAGSLEGVVVVVPPFSEGQDANLMRLGWAASITKEMAHDT